MHGQQNVKTHSVLLLKDFSRNTPLGATLTSVLKSHFFFGLRVAAYLSVISRPLPEYLQTHINSFSSVIEVWSFEMI